MRYFGTLTGIILNEGKQKVYREGEEPEYYKSYFAELVNVKDENGNCYNRMLIKATQKTALRIENHVLANNDISFDCKEIKDNVIIGIRNICYKLVGLGRYPYKIIDFNEWNERFGSNLGCIDCKYRNNKSDCSKYCIKERR